MSTVLQGHRPGKHRPTHLALKLLILLIIFQVVALAVVLVNLQPDSGSSLVVITSAEVSR